VSEIPAGLCQCGCGERTNERALQAVQLHALGLSQRKIAAQMGVTCSRVGQYLNDPPPRYKRGHNASVSGRERLTCSQPGCSRTFYSSAGQRFCQDRNCQSERFFIAMNDHTGGALIEGLLLKKEEEFLASLPPAARRLWRAQRAAAKSGAPLSLDAPISEDAGSATLMDTVAQRDSLDADPEAAYERREQQEAFAAALAFLRPEQARAVQMCHLEGYSTAEVATELGTTTAAVDKLLSSAAAVLKDVLGGVAER
jgi:RNA polymerase sigma factor (sigma-70 family)